MRLKQINLAEIRRVFERELSEPAVAGTILRDFEMLLDFIGEEGQPVSGQYNLFPLKVLPELNARLARAMGLTYIGHQDTKSRLWVDSQTRTAWTGLNPVERYFTLLESWLLRGSPVIIGERSGYDWRLDRMQSWSLFFEWLTERGRQIANDREAELHLRYRPGWYDLALLELFGLVTIEHLPPEPDGGWRIGRIERTPLGEVLLSLLVDHFFISPEAMLNHGGNEAEELSFGRLQPVIRPYAPQWQRNLVLPPLSFQDGLYVFKVSLGRVWRRLAVPAKSTLEELSDAILRAYDFDNDHLHCFTYLNRFGAPVEFNHSAMDEGPWTDEVQVGDLRLQPGGRLSYLFDFGDNWLFEVLLERIDRVDPQKKKPLVLESAGKAPAQYPAWEGEDEV